MTHLDSFLRFHKANPEVYRLFCAFTKQLIGAGRRSYSADAVLHRIRWHTAVETKGEPLKINDHYSSLYARLFMMHHGEYSGFFELRRLHVDEMTVQVALEGLQTVAA